MRGISDRARARHRDRLYVLASDILRGRFLPPTRCGRKSGCNAERNHGRPDKTL
jgi:hypothetical protein